VGDGDDDIYSDDGGNDVDEDEDDGKNRNIGRELEIWNFENKLFALKSIYNSGLKAFIIQAYIILLLLCCPGMRTLK